MRTTHIDRNVHLPTVPRFDVFYGFLYHLNMMEMPGQRAKL